jgi:EAL domain-containing protein (putative c-di-GMP-specific phosphodiesterase class I)
MKRLPIDRLKIDRGFVSALPFDANDVSITTAIITLAHDSGMSVVAEGVETQEQLDFLVEHGCDEMQGYLLGRPEPELPIAKRGKATG